MGKTLIAGELTKSILGAFYEVYRVLGYGFLERIYEAALAEELKLRKHYVDRQVPVVIVYKQIRVGVQRLDLIVDRTVVVEIKATHEQSATASRQLHNYRRATNLEVGLLLHFGQKPDFVRVVNSNGG